MNKINKIYNIMTLLCASILIISTFAIFYNQYYISINCMYNMMCSPFNNLKLFFGIPGCLSIIFLIIIYFCLSIILIIIYFKNKKEMDINE